MTQLPAIPFDLAAGAALVVPPRPDSSVAGRFVLRQLLGESNGTRTYLAEQADSASPVIAKAILESALTPGALMRLEYEAGQLLRVNSSGFARVLFAGREANSFWLVTEYIAGKSLRERLGSGGPDVLGTLAIGRSVLAALGDLHELRILHRGVRPANIITAAEGRIGKATLVDFGPIRPLELDGSLQSHTLEIARYASPEQAGSIEHDLTPASDLYSLGIVLFQCLTGKLPFDGDSVSTILFEHMTAPVPPLENAAGRVPRALEDVVQRMLKKDPRDRYQSAEAALVDLVAIGEAIGRGEPDPAIVIGARDKRATLTEPSFVAREEQIRAMDAEIAKARGGSGGLVLVEAESGGGKTRLLEETARRASREGLWVLRGQGTNDVAWQPFRLLGGVVDAILAAVRLQPELSPALDARLAEFRESISAALPALAPLFRGESSPAGPSEEIGETRTIQALAALLDALGAGDRPALVILDDFQWADELTQKLIRRWHSDYGAIGAGRRNVMIVVAFRAEEVASDHLLRKIDRVNHLRLPPLTSFQVRQLVESMAGPLPEVAGEMIERLAEGSPFMASAVLRGFVESGALFAQAEGWGVDAAALAAAGSSDRAGSFLAHRLDLLPQATVALLSTGAVLGKEFDLRMASQLSEQSPENAIEALDEARQRQLVWMRPDGAKCVFVHDKIRSAALDRMEFVRRKSLHRGAAQYLLEHTPESASDIAYHFDAADDSAAALPHALQSAEQARAQHALEIAEQQYRIALRGATSDEVRFEIVEGLGDALMLRGRYDSAGELFESAAPLAEGAYAQAKIRGKLGELAFRRGDMSTAIDHFSTGLRLLGRQVPRWTWLACVQFATEGLVQILHTLLPAFFLQRVARKPTDPEALSLRLLSYLSHGCWYSRSKLLALWAHLRGLNQAEKYLPSRELAQAYSDHGPAMTLVGAFGRGAAYAERATEMRKSLGDLWGQGQSLVYYGITLYAASRFGECVDHCRVAVRLLERMGDYWQVHMARYQIAASLYHLGDLRGAVEESQLNYRSGIDLGDEQASGIILDVWARATEGVLPAEILDQELARTRTDAQGTTQVMLADGLRHFANGQLDRAAEIFQRGARFAAEAGVTNAYTNPAIAWAATATRIAAEQAQDYTPMQRHAKLRAGYQAARRALRAGWLFRNDLAQSLRDYALVLAMQGRPKKSKKAFEKSLRIAKRLRQRHQEAQTLQAFAQVGLECHWPGAVDRAKEAQAIFAELTAKEASAKNGANDEPATLSLVARFDTVLDSGRKIASALAASAIYDSSRAAALRLLRGEHCLVLEFPDNESPGSAYAVQEESKIAIDDSLVQQALRSGRAVARTEDPASGVALAAIEPLDRSALCVPIRVRGRIVACLYVTHENVRGLFGPDEERLADFIATIAGAALENSEGFAELQQLNESLEQRVADRTAAAETRSHELALSNRELERIAQELRLAKEQLLAAKQTAENANAAKSRFLATMSHEIRTPMNGVLGMTELVLNTPLSDQQRNYVGIVKESANALLMLLNDILDLSKIEAGRMELERIEFSLQDVAVQAARLLAVNAAKKGLELICRIAPEIPARVLGDPNRLRQIIVNLIGNAVKFTAQGEIVVDLALEATEGSAAVIHGVVRDTGIGIPSDKLHTVFEAFRQTDSSTTRKFGGTGLGLSISVQFVELMGGRMWVESELGKGSAFHFLIRLESITNCEPEIASLDEPAAALVVARNASARSAYGEMLQSFGWTAQPVEDIPSAAALLDGLDEPANERPPLAIVDIAPNEPFDRALVERLMSPRRTVQPALIFLIPAGQVEWVERLGELGSAQCLVKPFKKQELANVLRAALGMPVAGDVREFESAQVSKTRPLKILVADDSPFNQQVAAGLLELEGHSVQLASDGNEAIEIYKRGELDFIFMDVEMPELDGMAATAAIRKLENSGRRIPIVGLSAHALVGFREQCLAAGMDDYIAKPIQTEELFGVLRLAVVEENPAQAADASGALHAADADQAPVAAGR